MKLDLTMLSTKANKPLSTDLEKAELLNINKTQTKGKIESFKRFGTIEKIVLVEFKNKYGIFKEYMFYDVFEVVKNNKNIRFLSFFNAVSTQKNKINVFLDNAKNTKNIEYIFLNIDQLKLVS